MTLSSKMIMSFKLNPVNSILKLLFYFLIVIWGLSDIGVFNAVLGSVFILNMFFVMMLSFDLFRKLISNVPLDMAWWVVFIFNVSILAVGYDYMGGFSKGIKVTLIVFILSPLLMIIVFDKLLGEK